MLVQVCIQSGIYVKMLKLTSGRNTIIPQSVTLELYN